MRAGVKERVEQVRLGRPLATGDRGIGSGGMARGRGGSGNWDSLEGCAMVLGGFTGLAHLKRWVMCV